MSDLMHFDIGYVAGVIDTKGIFQIDMNRPSFSKKHGNVASYAASLTVTTTSRALMNYLVKNTKARSLPNMGSFRVYWNYDELQELIPIIATKLIIKKEHVDLMLEFLKHTGIPGYQSQRMAELNRGIKKGNQGRKKGIKTLSEIVNAPDEEVVELL